MTYDLCPLLIRPQRQHHQRTGQLHFDALFAGEAHQFVVFRTGIEDDALGFQTEDVVVVFLLPGRVEVQGDGVDIFELRLSLFNGYPVDRSEAVAQGDDFMTDIEQLPDGHIGYAVRIDGGAQDEGFFGIAGD